MNLFFEQFIASIVTSAVTTTIATLPVRDNDDMLSFYKMIKKPLYLNISLLLSTFSAKAFTPNESPIKALSKR